MRTSEERVTAVRLPHLDNLKTVLVAWVIGGHALLGYSATGGWAYDEVREVTLAPVTELWLLAIIGPSGLFMMGLFFFIAGLLAKNAIARHGLRRYLGDRMLRLGLPWLVSALLLWPVSVWLAYVAAGWRVSPWWVFAHRDPLLDSGSLWFALVLLLYSTALALWRRARPCAGRRPSGPMTGAHLAGAIAVIALSSFVVRLWFPARSGQIADLHLWQWPQCLGLFTLGVVAARRGWHRHVPDRIWRTCAAVTLATLALLPPLALASGLRDVARESGPYLGGWGWEALATTMAEAVLVVAGAVCLVGAAERSLGATGPRARLWAAGAYAAFVIQGPVLMILASAIRPLDAPAELKAPLVATVGIIVCFWLGRRLPLLSRRPPRGTRRGPQNPATEAAPGAPRARRRGRTDETVPAPPPGGDTAVPPRALPQQP